MQNNLADLASKLNKLIKQKRFDDACRALTGYRDADLPVELLLLKATAIQLAEDSAGFTLNDARLSLTHATTTAPDRAEAWIDLGHFYFAVDSQALKALECFEKARNLCKIFCKDLILGEAKALLELDRKDDALLSLQSFGDGIISNEILLLKKEILGDDQRGKHSLH